MNKFTLAALVALTQGLSLSSMEAQEDEPAMLAQMPDVESLVCDLAKCWDMPTEPVNDGETDDWAATMQRCQRDALARDWDLAQSLSRPDYLEMLGMLRMKLSGGKKTTMFNTSFDTFNLYLARQHFRRGRRAQPGE